MVNAGDILTYTATVQAGFSESAGSVLADVSALMQQNGFQVYSSSSPGSSILGSIGAALTLSGTTVNISYKFSVPQAYGSVDDVKTIINGYVYQITGAMPSASSIQDIGTSLTEPTPANPTAAGGPFGSITTALESASVGTLVGIALAVFAIFWLSSKGVA